MGVVTLGVIEWATDPHGLVAGPHHGLHRLRASRTWSSRIATKDERRSIFNLDTFSDKPLLVASAAAIGVIDPRHDVRVRSSGCSRRPTLELEQWLRLHRSGAWSSSPSPRSASSCSAGQMPTCRATDAGAPAAPDAAVGVAA